MIVMLVMAMLLLAGTTFLTIASTETQIALNEQGSAAANVLAEAAIQKALSRLKADPSYAGETNTALGGGTFTINVTTVAGCTSTSARQVVATGSAPVRGGTAQAKLQVVLDQVSYPYQWAAFAAVPNEIVMRKRGCWECNIVFGQDRQERELWLDHDSLVDSFDSGVGQHPDDPSYNPKRDPEAYKASSGNIGANADVGIEYHTAINGDVQAGDAIHKSPSVTVTGTESSGLSPHENDPGVPFPSVAPPVTPSEELRVKGGKKVTLDAGTKYYTKITIEDNGTLLTDGDVKIYVTGQVSIGNNVTLGSHPGTQLQIIAKSDGSAYDTASFKAENGFKFYGSLYGKNTDVKLERDAQVFGSIIGRTVYVESGGKIHYDQALANQELCHDGKLTIRRGTWREVIPSN